MQTRLLQQPTSNPKGMIPPTTRNDVSSPFGDVRLGRNVRSSRKYTRCVHRKEHNFYHRCTDYRRLRRYCIHTCLGSSCHNIRTLRRWWISQYKDRICVILQQKAITNNNKQEVKGLVEMYRKMPCRPKKERTN